ncbi:glycoside hydrolase family 43 protein [Deinococcus sp. Arct2-2]|uniref:glycoside hydrolase family 43 protein n=1 Tax=Deinococcus sp. Arct2-2 TaxID=2568653 RepID=UPI001F0FE572|nr:glycoside hydrolase family 43 protein [Deinococcus sp. Arct2-2]
MPKVQLVLTLLFPLVVAACAETPLTPPTPPHSQQAPWLTPQAQTSIRNADPSVIRVGSTYYSVESDGTNIYSRAATSLNGLGSSGRTLIWSSPKNMPNLWAPELVRDPGTGRYYIYFASGNGGSGQRTYVTESGSPGSGYNTPVLMNLPDGKWAIDGISFFFNNQRYFVWSGWAGDTNVEQNLYIAAMSSPTTTTGGRSIISQPREGWERVIGNPYINEGPQPIKDPNGQLHLVYSANGSWSDQYCLADLRLRSGGNPANVWDWYKSNGCLFGSNRNTLMSGWDPTLNVNGPGHHSFVLLNGDIGTSPPSGSNFPMMYHAVPKGTTYSWGNRIWYSGSFTWWGNTTYSRSCCNGPNTETGWSLKFFE